jgi:hypothetical protein
MMRADAKVTAMTLRVRSIALLAVLLLWGGGLFGCSGNGDANDAQNIHFPDIGNDEDVEEQVDPCEDVQCEAGQTCVEGTCLDAADPGYSCAEPYDLGVLSGDGIQTFNANPVLQPNLMRTSCAAEDMSPEAVFRFQVAQPATLTFDVDRAFEEIPIPILAKELREDSCVNPDAALWCSINPTIFNAQPGVDYFLIVEANEGVDINEFVLVIEIEELVCVPIGARTCEDGVITHCFGGIEERFYECADTCAADGESCQGDVCSNAIEVRASGTYSGDFAAYQNSFDFSESPSCTTEGTTGVTSPGRDVAFLLPDLLQGDTISVDKGDLGLAVLAIMSSCAESGAFCVAADTTAGSLSWQVPDDGDYFVVIAPRTSVSGSFTFSIGIE